MAIRRSLECSRMLPQQVTNDNSIYWLNKFVTNLVDPYYAFPGIRGNDVRPTMLYYCFLLLFREYCLLTVPFESGQSKYVFGSSAIIAYSCCFKR